MNLHLLKIFVQAAQTQSFTKAADALEITQPAVSKGVRELESQLDTVLFDRRAKQVKLTEAGELLFQYGQSLLAIEKEAEEALYSFNDLKRGSLTIGASTTVASYWLPPLISAFRSKYPGIDIRLSGANTEQISRQLLACEIDVAVVEGEVKDPRLESRPWREEEMVAIGAPYVVAQSWEDEIQSWTWVLREIGSGSRAVSERLLSNMGIRTPQFIEVNSNEAIVQMVANGVGLGIVPRICARDQIALGRVQRISLPIGQMKRTLYRLRLPLRPVSAAALAFEGMLGTQTA
ncbi:LysR substrate-binding domain-containing protein [Limnobacter sp.]|uniref:LysR substrate-binding domain-containing protein n=1 Tax=Limnobacter sp. TaxID=2003368 RepID=UPI0025866157|nr:LysR substrate-binding domain-containing protein [Limnobacter sp.]